MKKFHLRSDSLFYSSRVKIHYSTSGISSGSLDIHSKRSDHWGGSDLSDKKSKNSLHFFLYREYGTFSFLWGGGTHLFGPFCPNRESMPESRWAWMKISLRGGGGGEDSFPPSARNVLFFYSSIGVGVHEILITFPTKYFDKQKKKGGGGRPNLCPNSGLIGLEIPRILPEFCPNHYIGKLVSYTNGYTQGRRSDTFVFLTLKKKKSPKIIIMG